MIELTDVRVAAPGAAISELEGVIEGTTTRLTLENLPSGHARLEVYFRSPAG